jgi:glycine/D-amino acid oxidase-like deaminating enzyme
MKPTLPTLKTRLTIIGSDGAIGLPASYLASLRPLVLTTISSQPSALASSTHTIHTSLVRPNCAVWPFGKALGSWLNNGPFDIRVSPGTLGFGLHCILQSYCVTESQVLRMWKALRGLALESRGVYMELDRELDGIRIGESGRGHLASPFVEDGKEAVLALREKLRAVGVKSDLLTSGKELQDYVGRLKVRRPELMVRYPEDFVLDLTRYKTQLLRRVATNGGIHIQDTVIGLEQDSRGNVTTVLTAGGSRVQTDMVFYAGGWKARQFMKTRLGINLGSHLNVASGVRFELPGHLVDRSIVCGSMFLAPSHDALGNPVTDVGQMFLVNFTDPYPGKKHRVQAVERFHSYFDYQGDIPKIWNCVGRPITTTGLPFLERVAPNMVAALGAGMFGVTIGAGLAQRGLSLLLDNKSHPDHHIFTRQSAWKITSAFFRDKISSTKTPTQQDPSPSPPVPPFPPPHPPPHQKPPRVIQLGHRGAMTTVLASTLRKIYPYAVYPSRSTAAAIADISTHPHAVLLVATHGPLAKLPAHYGAHYVPASAAITAVLSAPETRHLSGIVVVSGGMPGAVLEDLARRARAKGVGFVYLPSLATSVVLLLKAVRVLLSACGAGGRGTGVGIEDTFHREKKEVPSTAHGQLLAATVERFGEDGVVVLVGEEGIREELRSQYPRMAIEVAAGRDDEIAEARGRFPGLVPVVSRSFRVDEAYRCQHRFTLQENDITVALEQSLVDRAQLVSPARYAIEKLATGPPCFCGMEAGAVAPVVDFEPAPSLVAGVRGIIDRLGAVGSITSIRVRDVSQGCLIQRLLTDRSGKMLRFQHTPELSCSLYVAAQIDGQDFSISISTES